MENWFEISQLFANLAGGRLIPGFPLDSYLDLSFSYAIFKQCGFVICVKSYPRFNIRLNQVSEFF